MRKPKMIIFDAGRTLIDYVSVDTRKGIRTLMRYIMSNPRDLTVEEIDKMTNGIFAHFESSRKRLYEIPAKTILKLVYDCMDIRMSISYDEIERIIWTEDAFVEAVDDAAEVIGQINEMGIRTAVISNLDFSGYLLQDRLNELFPDNRFEFVLASSDYGVRKPEKLIFQAGIARSGLKPEEIWYVGDKLHVDVAGSHAAGMIPVLYRFKRNAYGELPDDLIAISSYRELVDLLRNCQ